MFEQTFLSTRATARHPFGVLAVGLQIVGVGLITLVPLFYTQPLPTAQLHLLVQGPPLPGRPKTITPTSSRNMQTVPHPTRFRLIAPVVVPHRVASVNDAASDAPTIAGAATGVPEGSGGTDLLTGTANDILAKPPVMVEKPATAAHGPVRVGGSVAAANLIQQIQPVYPALARSARVEGTVEFSATIDKSGAVVNLKLVSGHPLLVNAARDAILQWRYRPTMLNGQPVEVMTTITVNFRLAH